MWYIYSYSNFWLAEICSSDWQSLEKRPVTDMFLIKFILYYYTSLKKRYLIVLPEEGNVPEANFAIKFSKLQNFTLTPDYLFKSTSSWKSENWWPLGNIGFVQIPFKYYCNFPFLKKSETILSVWHNSSLGPKISEMSSGYARVLVFNYADNSQTSLRLACPLRLKYWCYFRWVLGYKRLPFDL